MKRIELVKFIVGLIFSGISFISAITFFLGYWGYSNGAKYSEHVSAFTLIWGHSWDSAGSSFAPIYLGLCALAGAYLLANTNLKDENHK